MQPGDNAAPCCPLNGKARASYAAGDIVYGANRFNTRYATKVHVLGGRFIERKSLGQSGYPFRSKTKHPKRTICERYDTIFAGAYQYCEFSRCHAGDF
jgi:hypothetical protein